MGKHLRRKEPEGEGTWEERNLWWKGHVRRLVSLHHCNELHKVQQRLSAEIQGGWGRRRAPFLLHLSPVRGQLIKVVTVEVATCADACENEPIPKWQASSQWLKLRDEPGIRGSHGPHFVTETSKSTEWAGNIKRWQNRSLQALYDHRTRVKACSCFRL